MRNILEQMITLFPGVNIGINYADGDSVSGRLDSIFPAQFTLTSFVGTPATVNIIVGGTATGNHHVKAVGFGAVFLGSETLVSTCKIENIKF
ncbi:MAG: hypothetical protein WC996_04680 [Peptostreptococcales bacterium]